MLRELQTVPMLPDDFEGESFAAELRVHPSGRFLYGSNRGHESVAIFSIEPGSGQLHAFDRVATQGASPRSIALDPTGRFLLVANEQAGTVVSFGVDGETGRLMSTSNVTEMPSPSCISFVAAS